MKLVFLTRAAALLIAISSTVATAAEIDISQLGLTHEQVEELNAQLTAPATGPGVAFGSPVAYGAKWGQVFAGVGGNTLPANSSEDVDGSMSLGYGLGNPYTFVGLEVVATYISLTDEFGDSGDVNFKAHKALPGNSAIAVGVDNTLRWGDARTTKASTYAVFTKAVALAPSSPRNPLPLTVSVGLGNGRFADPGENGVGMFGSLAFAPHRQLSLILDATGRDINAGVSVVPLRRWPVVVTVGAINLAQNYGRDIEFAGGIGYLFSE